MMQIQTTLPPMNTVVESIERFRESFGDLASKQNPRINVQDDLKKPSFDFQSYTLSQIPIEDAYRQVCLNILNQARRLSKGSSTFEPVIIQRNDTNSYSAPSFSDRLSCESAKNQDSTDHEMTFSASQQKEQSENKVCETPQKKVHFYTEKVEKVDSECQSNEESFDIPHPTLRKRRANTKSDSRSSIYRGVSRNGRMWQVQVGACTKSRYMGRFTSEIDAARAHDRHAIRRLGKAAKTNFTYTKAQVKEILQAALESDSTSC